MIHKLHGMCLYNAFPRLIYEEELSIHFPCEYRHKSQLMQYPHGNVSFHPKTKPDGHRFEISQWSVQVQWERNFHQLDEDII